MRLFRRIRCYFGQHKRLDVIQSFGAAQHIGCPDCGKEFGIHHGVRAVIPWDSDLADMYFSFGHDPEGPARKWRFYRRHLYPRERN